MKRTAVFCSLLVFAFTVFSSPAYPAIPFLMSQNRDSSVATATAIQMPLLVQVLRAAEHEFLITSKWRAYPDGFYATREDAAGLFKRSNALVVRVFWNGFYGVYCGSVEKEVLFSNWESLLVNQNDRKDPCK